MQSQHRRQAASPKTVETFQVSASFTSNSGGDSQLLGAASASKPVLNRTSELSARSSQTSSSTKGTKVVVVDLQTPRKAKKQKTRRPANSKASMAAAASSYRNGISAAAASSQLDAGGNQSSTPTDEATTGQNSSSTTSLEMTPKRSRSEAPTGNSIGNVLYEVHKKLMSRVRKLSPAKLQAKQQERQQRAEHLRQKIELSRKEWSKKVRQRQQLARARFQETVERKRLNLMDRLEQAARNKEAELQNVVEKAKAENLKAEETNFIIKLTQKNHRLDLRHKLTDHEERRKLQQEKDMERIKGQELKREAAGKRRVEQFEEMRTKILSKEQKREQAEQRRKEQQIAEKNKAIAEKTKRDLVRARKHVKKHKISDIINFVSNRESLWEFIGMENDLASMGLQFNLEDIENALEETGDTLNRMSEQELLSTIQQDQFELEKLMLKRDHELLSACISEEPDGSIKITQNPITLLYRGAPKSTSSASSVDSGEEVKERANWLHQQKQQKKLQNQSQFASAASGAGKPKTESFIEESKQISPKKQPSWTSNSFVVDSAPVLTNNALASNDLNRLRFIEKQRSFKSNMSSSNQTQSVRSKDDLTSDNDNNSSAILALNDERSRGKEAPSSPHGIVSAFARQSNPGVDGNVTAGQEQRFEQKMQQQRLRVAVRRNILKRNLSEDLVYAAELQANPNFDFVRFISGNSWQDVNQVNYRDRDPHSYHQVMKLETRSQTSSLERNSFEDLEDDTLVLKNGQNDPIESANETPTKGVKIVKTSTAALAKKHKTQNKGKQNNQSSRSSLHSSGPFQNANASGGSKDLNPLMGSNRHAKRSSIHSIHEIQQPTLNAKQKKTLSKQGSCSSLSSLIKSKIKHEDAEDFNDLKSASNTGTLNQAQLEQLGPVVKMTINGFPFTQSVPPYMMPTSPCANAPSQLLSNQAPTEASDPDAQSNQSATIFSAAACTNHSFQLNSLIMSHRAMTKNNLNSVHLMSSNLSKQANLYLFPIREQKIILMYKEKDTEFHFVQAKINLKLEEFKLSSDTLAQPAMQQTPSLGSQPSSSAAPLQQLQAIQQTPVSKKALLDGGASDLPTTVLTSSPATPIKGQQSSNGKQSSIVGSSSMVEETKRTPTKSNQQQLSASTPNSAKKERSAGQSTGALAATDVDDVGDEPQVVGFSGQSDRMVNLIVKKLLIDQMQHIRRNDSQNSILFDNDKDSQAVLKYLEVSELLFKYCRLCEVAIYSEYSASSDALSKSAIQEHFCSKAHIRKRESLQIKESEDTAFSLLVFSSQPGEIEVELRKENEKALKRKARKLKALMQQLAVSHENASTYPGKELKSDNKNRLQIRCIELQKSVFPDIKFDTVEAILNDVLKVLEKRGTGDLHQMRKLKLVPIMVDSICKRISTCPKGKLSNLAKVINQCIKILSKFCSLRENRNYMIQTNRLMPLIDLLSWCLNRQTELFFGIEFMPGLFQTITSHLKHRVPYECQLLKEHMVDLLISSQIPAKLKHKLAIVKSLQSNENEESLGQLPFFLLKSVAFLEALTAMISIDARTRPVYEKSFKIGEHVFFVLQSTELFGIIQMITTLLLTCNETFKASAPYSANNLVVLPQTILSLTIFSIKVLNNVMRMDVGIAQNLMHDLNEQLYHLLSFILTYTETHIDENDDAKELLHETLIFIGYFCLLNEGYQKTLHRGENSILQKLCNLPFTYFMDKKLKEILFPTLVTVGYLNERSVAIMDQEMNMSEFLVKYIENNIKEELPKIMEQEQEYFSDHTKSMSSFGRARSPSQHSTGSNSAQSVQMDFLSGNNPYLPFVMRFPKNLWKNAAQYFKSKAD